MKKGILIILALYSAVALFAKDKTGVTRTAEHTVTINTTDAINIQGKNTLLEIETWDKNQVQVVATVTFDGKMTSRIQDFLDSFEANVKDNIAKSGGELMIGTDLDQPNKVQIGRERGVTISYGDKELRIAYKIKLPGKNALNVIAAYEDLYMSGTYSDVNISQNSADLHANAFEKAKLYLKYGDADIRRIGSGYIESYENDVELESANYLKINDKYSEFSLGDVKKIEMVGYETDLSADKIETLSGNLKYGELKIEERLGKATLTLYEFDLSAGEVGLLVLENSKYCDFDFDSIDQIDLTSSYEDDFEADFLNKLTARSKYGNYNIKELGTSFILNGYEDDISIESIKSNAKSIELEGKYLVLDLGTAGLPYALYADVKYGDIDYNENSLTINKRIKDNDQLFIEAIPRNTSQSGFQVRLRGYEVDADID